MSDVEDDLRATSADLVADAEALRTLEEAKLTLDPSDPRTLRLAEESERLAREMVPKAAAEADLAREARRRESRA